MAENRTLNWIASMTQTKQLATNTCLLLSLMLPFKRRLKPNKKRWATSRTFWTKDWLSMSTRVKVRKRTKMRNLCLLSKRDPRETSKIDLTRGLNISTEASTGQRENKLSKPMLKLRKATISKK